MADPARLLDAGPQFSGQGIVFDRAGFKVDANGWVWTLNHAVAVVKLDFHKLRFRSPTFLREVASFIAERVKVSSVDDVRNTFETLQYLNRSEHFREVDASAGILGEKVISDLRLISEFAHNRLHYIRVWYCWCADQGMDQFSERIAERLREIRISGNEHGHAVRTQDPVKGAFDEIEFISLITKLRALGPARLTTQENALSWLAIASGSGSNPLAYALLRENDFKPLKEGKTGRI